MKIINIISGATIIGTLFAGIFFFNQAQCDESNEILTIHNPISIYFSYPENIGKDDMPLDALSGASLREETANKMTNQQQISAALRDSTGADEFSIKTTEPYNSDYDLMRDRAYAEIDDEAFPSLVQDKLDLSTYDVIFLGTPVWSGHIPRPIATFLKHNKYARKNYRCNEYSSWQPFWQYYK